MVPNFASQLSPKASDSPSDLTRLFPETVLPSQIKIEKCTYELSVAGYKTSSRTTASKYKRRKLRSAAVLDSF